MIGIIAALLLQSVLPQGMPPQISPDFSGNSEVTPKDLTSDAGILNCSLTGDDGRTFKFYLRDAGGRGYRDPATGEVAITEDEISAKSDPATLFEGYSFRKGGGAVDYHYNAWAKAPGAFGKEFEFDLSRVNPPSQSRPTRYAILLTAHWDWMPLARAVGFCELRRTAQQPLNDAETRKYLKL